MVEIKKRRTLLTVWLILMLVFNSIGALFWIFIGGGIIYFYPQIQSEQLLLGYELGVFLVYYYGIISLLYVMSTIFLLRWKKWAFYVILGGAILTFIVDIFIIHSSGPATLFNFIPPLVLYLIMKPQWNLFE